MKTLALVALLLLIAGSALGADLAGKVHTAYSGLTSATLTSDSDRVCTKATCINAVYASFFVSITAGDSTFSITPILQYSYDGTNWNTLHSASAITTTAVTRWCLSNNLATAVTGATAQPLAPYHRVLLDKTAGGGTETASIISFIQRWQVPPVNYP